MKNVCLAFLVLFSHTLFSQTEKGIVPVSSTGTPKQSGTTRAVVIGISDYQDVDISDLRFAHRDAEAVADWLRSLSGGSLDDDHLKVLINEQATAGRVAEALDALIEQSKEGDHVLIYFSGHGDVERKTLSQPGFLLCWDAPSRVYMGGGTYSLAFLQEIVSTLSVQNKAKVTVITDACHAGKLAGNQIGGAQLTSANLAKQFANEVKILSCQPNEFSLEGEQWGGGRGCFSYHLVDGLFGLADRNSDGTVTVGELDRYLEDRVTVEAAPQSQVPMLIGSKSERLATVNPQILADLQKHKASGNSVFATTETRGLEEEILAEADSTTRQMYYALKRSIAEKRFFEPENDCAEFYYDQLSKIKVLLPLSGVMRRNYAAALQDDAQQVLNARLRSEIKEIGLSPKNREEKYRKYPRYLEKAAFLLGEEHYMFKDLKARQWLFEGYLISLRNPEIQSEENGKKALDCYYTSLKYQPNSPHTYYFMSLIFADNLMNADSAYFYANRALELSPNWLLPCTGAIHRFAKSKKFDFARYFLDYAEHVDSNSAIVFLAKGEYTFYLRDMQNANKYFQKTISIDSNFVWGFNYLGLLNMDNGKMHDAETYLLKAISIDSTSKQPYFNLGIVYFNLGKLEKSRYFTSKALQIDSSYARAYTNLGDIFMKEQKFDKAEEMYLKAMGINSTNPYVYYDAGRFYWDMNDYTKAEKMFLTAIQLDPNETRFYDELGVLYFDMGLIESSKNQFYKILQINPNNKNAFYNLACLVSIEKDTEKAYEYLEKALQNEYNKYDWLQEDTDLAILREQPERWKALMKKYFPDRIKD